MTMEHAAAIGLLRPLTTEDLIFFHEYEETYEREFTH